jgi:hypothetical protein
MISSLCGIKLCRQDSEYCLCEVGVGVGGKERETACKSKSNFRTLITFLICLRDYAVIRFCGAVQECTNPGCPMHVNFIQ